MKGESVILEVTEPFFITRKLKDGTEGADTRFIYTQTIERHRDAARHPKKVHKVLRGRDMRAWNEFKRREAKYGRFV